MIEEPVTRSFETDLEKNDLEKNDLAKIGLATTEVATNEAVRIAADEAGEVVADRLPRAETIRTMFEMMSLCHRNSRRGTKRTTSMIGIKKNDPLAPSGKTERMRATSVRARRGSRGERRGRDGQDRDGGRFAPDVIEPPPDEAADVDDDDDGGEVLSASQRSAVTWLEAVSMLVDQNLKHRDRSSAGSRPPRGRGRGVAAVVDVVHVVARAEPIADRNAELIEDRTRS
ncbi:MAG: hypothetical protein R3B96_13300 [Pirellulaceae bacterium]